jgi:hypothetical protein
LHNRQIKVAPNPYKSVASVKGRLFTCSGDIKPGVPKAILLNAVALPSPILANPKSIK